MGPNGVVTGHVFVVVLIIVITLSNISNIDLVGVVVVGNSRCRAGTSRRRLCSDLIATPHNSVCSHGVRILTADSAT